MRVKLDEGAFAPERAHKEDAGLDIRTPRPFVIYPHCGKSIDTGVHVEIQYGYVGFLKSKSGLYVNNSITSDGTIDSGYSGSIVCKLINHGNTACSFKRGDKITQLVVVPCLLDDAEIVDEINSGDRGNSGFGSTGR